MKRLLFASLILVTLAACRDPNVPASTATATRQIGLNGNYWYVYEVEIDGHKYFMSPVHGGLTLCPKVEDGKPNPEVERTTGKQ